MTITSTRQTGAYFVEIVLLIPLFLLGVYFFIFFGYYLHLRSSFNEAVSKAARLAIPRSNSQILDSQISEAFENYLRDGAIGLNDQTRALLATADLQNPSVPDYYDEHWLQPVFDRRLAEMPEVYLHTVVYLNEAIRQSVGQAVRFPCEPNQEDGAGCFSCLFLNPDSVGNNSIDELDTVDTPYTNRLYIRCRYRPTGILVDPVVALLRIFNSESAINTITFEAESFVEAPFY